MKKILCLVMLLLLNFSVIQSVGAVQLQYEDFNYQSSDAYLENVGVALAADAQKGFSSGWSNVGTAAWKVFSSYLKAEVSDAPNIYRTVNTQNRIITAPATDGENVYYIFWDFYFDADTTFDGGSCMQFRKGVFKAGVNTYENGKTYAYLSWSERDEYWGREPIIGGKWYRAVIQLTANSEDYDEIKFKLYPKDEFKAGWDIEDVYYAANTEWDILGIVSKTNESSADVRFADYSVEHINTKAEIDAVLAAESAIAKVYESTLGEAEDSISTLTTLAENKIAAVATDNVQDLLLYELESVIYEGDAQFAEVMEKISELEIASTQEKCHEVQSILNALPGSEQKATYQNRLNEIADQNGYVQFIFNSYIGESGELKQEKNVGFNVQIRNGSSYYMAVAGYCKNKLEAVKLCSGEYIEYTEDFGFCDSVKLICLEADTLSPQNQALVFDVR